MLINDWDYKDERSRLFEVWLTTNIMDGTGLGLGINYLKQNCSWP